MLDSGLMLAASWPLLKVGQKSKNKNLKKLILCRVEGFLFDFELTSMMMILGHLLEDSWVVLYSVCSKIQLHNFWVGITWTLHRRGKVFFEFATIFSYVPSIFHSSLFYFLFAIFCQNFLTKIRSRKTKIFTWKYIRMNPNVKFFARWTLVIPLISKKLNLGDFQKTGIPMDMRPAFFSRVLEKWVGMLILWSRNQDWWFLFFA